MNRMLSVAIAVGVTLGASGLAMAQSAYGPNTTYYPPNYYAPAYAPPPASVAPAPPVAAYPEVYDGTHSSGGASRAYSYWGAQKSN